MITEDYVSFEVAKLLKEKGFDVYGDGSFNTGIEIFAEYSPSGAFNKCITSKPHQKGYPAPTLQTAMKWLRETHNLYTSVLMGFDVDNPQYYFFVPSVTKFTSTTGEYITPFDENEFDTYEEACEAAIKYCLENLI